MREIVVEWNERKEAVGAQTAVFELASALSRVEAERDRQASKVEGLRSVVNLTSMVAAVILGVIVVLRHA